MTKQTRIQIKLMLESGYIHYLDSEDGCVFHVEDCDSYATRTGGRNEDEDAAEAATKEVIKSFLRQHLLKNGHGESCHVMTPLMKTDSIGPLMKTVVDLCVGGEDGEEVEEGNTVYDPLESSTSPLAAAEAVSGMYRTLGKLVSLLQQREKVLKAAAEIMAKVNAKHNGMESVDDGGGGNDDDDDDDSVSPVMEEGQDGTSHASQEARFVG